MPEEKTKHIGILSKALQTRNKEALEFIHTHYYHRIRSYVSGSVGSGQDAEDLTQEVFVELSRKNGQIKDIDNPEAYLFGISRNIINQYARKKKKSVKTIPIIPINEPNTYKTAKKDPFERILLSERKQIIEEAVQKLPPKSREAIKLRFIDGLNNKEASEKEECTKEVFCRRLYEGIKILRKIVLEHKNYSLKK